MTKQRIETGDKRMTVETKENRKKTNIAGRQMRTKRKQ